MFPNAKFLVGANEIRFAYWADPIQRQFFMMDDLVPTRGYNWLEVGEDYDLFGDGSVQMLKTPGHTPGECTLLVDLPSRKFVLTGDTVHTRQDLAEEKPMDDRLRQGAGGGFAQSGSSNCAISITRPSGFRMTSMTGTIFLTPRRRLNSNVSV